MRLCLYVIIYMLPVDLTICTHTHTLSVRPQSGYFGGGGPGVGDMTDDAASDYLKRSAELNA